MSASADTLRVILALTHFEAWPPWRVARVLGLRPKEVEAVILALKEFEPTAAREPRAPSPSCEEDGRGHF